MQIRITVIDMHTEVNDNDKYAHLSDCAMHNETKKSIKSLGCKTEKITIK
jgi:hypothetical protein